MTKRPSNTKSSNGFGDRNSASSRKRGKSLGFGKSNRIKDASPSRVLSFSKGAAAAAAFLMAPTAALALPNGLQVRGGKLTVSQPDGTSIIINQSTDRAAGDWSSFDINAGEKVEIRQPDTNSLMLGRVTGGSPTSIQGSLSANGGVILINPNGMLIGPGSIINTSTFVASTSDVNPAAFMAGGSVEFVKSPLSPDDARIINQGTISVSDAGLVALLAPSIQNDGVIAARLGKVELSSGTQATLDLTGDSLLSVVLDPSVAGSITNNGEISAGYVLVGGGDAADFISSAINLNGFIEATGLDGNSGLLDINTSGDLIVNGNLKAVGSQSGQSGGTINLLGDRIALLESASVDVSGVSGGGEVLIGGNYLGQGPEPNASATVLAPGSKVKADALSSGDGGRVIVWSDEYTGFYGDITAKGSSTGNGGFVETSSKDNLQAFGNVSAGGGLSAGQWLLDPRNVQIAGAEANGGFAGDPSCNNTIILNGGCK